MRRHSPVAFVAMSFALAACMPDSDEMLTTVDGSFYLSSDELRAGGDGVVRGLAPDVVLTVIGDEDVPLAGKYSGRLGVAEYLVGFVRSIALTEVTTDYVLEEGQKINVHLRIKGEVRDTGSTIDLDFVYAVLLNDRNLVQSIGIYYDTATFRSAFANSGIEAVDFKSPDLSWDPDATGAAAAVWAGYTPYIQGDVPTAMEHMADDVLWILKGDASVMPFAGVFQGKAGVLQFMYNLLSTAYYTDLQIHYTVEQGNRVDFHVYEELINYETGKMFGINIVQGFIVTPDGLIKEFKSHNDSWTIVKAYTP